MTSVFRIFVSSIGNQDSGRWPFVMIPGIGGTTVLNRDRKRKETSKHLDRVCEQNPKRARELASDLWRMNGRWTAHVLGA
jgi:hypothetical protein